MLAVGGVQNPVPAGATAGTQAQLLSFIGVAGARQEYPLSTSINLYSIVVSSSLAGLVVLRLRAPELLPRIVAWPAILICFYEVISGDSRTTLAVALVVVLVFVIWRRFAGAPVGRGCDGVLPADRDRRARGAVELRRRRPC